MDGLIHDIRNLLTIIRTNLEVMGLKTGPDAPGKDNLMNALRALEHLGSLLDRKNREEAVIDLNLEAANIRDELDLAAANRGVSLVCQAGVSPMQVRGADVRLLRRALLNIALNAVEAARSHVDIQTGIWFEPLQAAVKHVVSITDDGPGIDPVDLPLVFQAGASRKGRHRGQGLHMVMQAASRFNRMVVYTSSTGTAFHLVFNPCASSCTRLQEERKCG